MQETENIFSQDFFLKHLSTINNIRFTGREIDVISCILSGRKTSKIAILLSIESTRTVEKHISNIMFKIKCNTREGIIDFIEKSDALPFLRKHYALLQIEGIFEKNLKAILKLKQEKGEKLLPCFLMQIGQKDSFSSHLITHLKLVGVALSTAARSQQGDCGIFVFPNRLVEEDVPSLLEKLKWKTNNVLFLLRNRKNNKEIPQELRVHNVVDFAKENYYFSFFLVLKKLFPNLNLEKIIADFKDDYKKIHNEPKSLKSASNEDVPTNRSVNTKSYLLISFLIVGLIIGGLLAIHWYQKNHQETTLRTDLILPKESAFLNRPEILSQIDDKLKSQNGIQALALVGQGGAGKTTLARQYASQQTGKIVWEINAETPESLRLSFEQLAQSLSKTEESQKVLKDIQSINDPTRKEERVIQFVKEGLQSKSNWFLVYDNVEKFSDIQKYFPHDSTTWGQGTVILTTRNSNVGNNKHINSCIQIGELTSDQKTKLFIKIVDHDNKTLFTPLQMKELKNFLEHIPPFPLDVSIAAYYLKTTQISYATYLENLLRYNKDFENVQQNLLKEAGDYIKTRYGIISLSLEHMMRTNEDFRDLLLFISLLNSQNIPRDLLENYKNKEVADSFLYNLKKHSLIIEEMSNALETKTAFSLHRSTQAVVLAYLVRALNLENNKNLIKQIGKVLHNYAAEAADKEDFPKINILAINCEMFLSHANLLTDFSIASVAGELGNLYMHLGNYEKAKRLLELSLVIYRKTPYQNHPWVARTLGCLGNIYRNLRNYEKASQFLKKSHAVYRKNSYEGHPWFARTLIWLGCFYKDQGHHEKAIQFFEEGIKIYRKNSYENHPLFARVLVWMGGVYSEQGNYEKARELLEESLVIYRKNSYENHPLFAWALRRLGGIYTELGRYNKAKDLLELSLAIYRKNSYETHPWFARALTWIGHVYSEQGNYEKARKLLEESLVIYRKNSYENHPWFSLTLARLGAVYRDLGDYEKAKDLLKQSVETYGKIYGKEHVYTAEILRSVGQTYFLEGQIETAENYFHKALVIFQKKNHPGIYTVLENLTELYLKKSMQAANIKDTVQSQDFRNQAINSLKQALEIVKTHFPEDSPHIIRIHQKLKSIEQIALTVHS